MKWLALLFVLFMLVIILLADLGAIPAPIKMIYDFPNGDRVGHYVLYGILTFLIDSAFPRTVKIASVHLLLGTLAIAVLAALEEFSQRFLPHRTPDVIDLTFSLLGIACGDLFFRLIRRRQLTH